MTHPDLDNNDFKRGRGRGLRSEGRGRKRGRGGPEGRHGRGGKGGPKRALRHGDLRYLIMALIQDAPRHGYDMMSEIEALSKGAYKPSPGVIYPALELVQDMGWAKVEVQEDKKSYVITDAGKTVLSENEDRIATIYARLSDLSQPKQEGEIRPLRMALDGLRHDVKSFMRNQNPDDGQREALAAIISNAREEVAALAKASETK